MDKVVSRKKLFGGVYQGKKVLVTGHTGFKGSWLTAWLLQLGADVYGISNGIPTKPSHFEELGLRKKIVHFEEDVRDLDVMVKIVKKVKPDFLFHLAAQPIVSLSYTDPIKTVTSNVVGTANILEALRLADRKCVAVIITSDKCYDNVEQIWGYKEGDTLGGKDVYSGSKGAAELICKSYYHSFFKNNSPVRMATARAGNVIGGGDWAADRIVPDCMRAWSKNKTVAIRSPKATRPWQHVLEPLSGYLLLGEALLGDASLSGSSFNFGPRSDYTQTVQTVLEDLSACWQFSSPKEAYAVVDGTKFHEAGLLKLNCEKAAYYLKWSPVLDYKTCVDFTGKWYFSFYKKKEDMMDYTLNQIKEYERLAAAMKLPWTN
jgi:CDP-glucose 4,6-dehydratase